MKRHPLQPTARHRAAGFTLVELLVALAIGLALVLAITVMLFRYESGRRALTAKNDASMGSAYAAYLLDRTLRSAGSGYSQQPDLSFGCLLHVARSGAVVSPRSTAFPAPFDTVPVATAGMLLPLVIYQGIGIGGSDVLRIMSGSSGLGETSMKVASGSNGTSITTFNFPVGLRPDDLFMLLSRDDGGSIAMPLACGVQQAASSYVGSASTIALGGTYATASLGTMTLSAATAPDRDEPLLFSLGDDNGNRPQFQLIGVGADTTLVSHDLFQFDGDASQVTPLVDGVADLRALYGVDTTGDGKVDSWVEPAGTWAASALLATRDAAVDGASRILAVRVGLFVRTNAPERAEVTPTSLKVFSDLPALEVTRTLSPAEQKLHWRVLDLTVPLRNLTLNTAP